MKIRLVLAVIILAFPGCGQDMKNNSRVKPFDEDKFFKDESSARPLPEGTVARGQLKYPTPFFTGKKEGRFARQNPVPISIEFLRRGQERFNIYCAVCHARTGDGNGMIVQRGFPRPESFYTPRLRGAPEGYFFDVITNGKGSMSGNRDVLNEYDRWAIAAYIRVLQRSRESRLTDAPAEIQKKLGSIKDQGILYE